MTVSEESYYTVRLYGQGSGKPLHAPLVQELLNDLIHGL